MRLTVLAVVLASSVGASPLAQSSPTTPPVLTGQWRAEFVGPIGPRPKMVDDFVFTFRDTPSGLAGTAKAEPGWPGDLDVSEIHVSGDRFSFVGTSHLGSRSDGVSQCCPRLVFAGTLGADTMSLSMTWTSTDTPNAPNAKPVPMQARRVN